MTQGLAFAMRKGIMKKDSQNPKSYLIPMVVEQTSRGERSYDI